MSIGALIVLLSLASDPFIQQVVTITSQPNPSNTPSISIPKAKNYIMCDVENRAMGEAINSVLAAGVDPGNATAVPATGCLSGNCDYDTFNTLAICSRCSDVTSELVSIPTVIEACGGDNDDSGNCTNELIPGTILQYKDGVLQNPNKDAMIALGSMSSLSAIWNISLGWAPGPRPGPLDIIRFVSINVTDINSVLDWPNSTVTAEECVLSFCIQRIQSAVRNGIPTNSVQTMPATISTTTQPTSTPTGYTVGEGPLCDSPTTVLVESNSSLETYLIDSYSQDLIWFFLQPLTGLVASVHWNSSGHTATLVDDDIMTNDDASGWLHASTNLSQTFETIATAMTQTVRQNDGIKVAGRIIEQVTIVQVRWAWLVLPLLNIILGSMFLVLTIVVTNKAKLPLWKEGVLPVLMHGFESTVDIKSIAELNTNTAMDDYAKYINIRLHEPANGRLALVTERSYAPLANALE